MQGQIIVCEGTHDEAKIKEVFKDAFCITTNGSEVSKGTLNMIKEYAKTNEIIIFTDPDYPGERIRNLVLTVAPNASHAFIKKDLCISKNHKKVGVEHASKEDIIDALKNLYNPSKYQNHLNMDDLYSLGLVGKESSKKLRDKISLKLNIGCPNAKTFLNRLNSFGITKEKILEAMNE